jgi:hypothetical protein
MKNIWRLRKPDQKGKSTRVLRTCQICYRRKANISNLSSIHVYILLRIYTLAAVSMVAMSYNVFKTVRRKCTRFYVR